MRVPMGAPGTVLPRRIMRSAIIRLPARYSAPLTAGAPPARRGALVVTNAMFDDLTSSVQTALRKLGPDAKLTRENIKEPMRDIRRALLEAGMFLFFSHSFAERQGVTIYFSW